MAKSKSSHGQGFFWQGVWILLPVALLSVIGLVSLRQDRLLAEQEAREAGKVLAQRLAQAIAGPEAIRTLRDYDEASFNLHANRTADLGLSMWMGGIESEDAARQRIKTWELANPEIDLSVLPPAGDQQKWPPDPSLPEPPAWLSSLTSEQQRLRQSARESEFTSGDSSSVRSAIERFLSAKPPEGARANAEYLLLLAKTRGLAAESASAQFSTSRWNSSAELTDAGLPVGQLICYQALRLMPDAAGVSDEFLATVAWSLYYRHSIFSARLIAEVERVARGTDSENKAATLRAWWLADEAQRLVMEDVYKRQSAGKFTNTTVWATTGAGDFLLVLRDRAAATNEFKSAEAPFFAPVAEIFPRAMVAKALVTAVDKSGISIPTYALAEFEMGGQWIALPHGETAVTTNGAVLGMAGGVWEGLPRQVDRSDPFQVRVLLASPEILYARQRQRTWLFGALILASAIAAAMGLAAAYLSFRRQQELGEMKTNFVSSVSHELRAPIASVRLMAENMEQGRVPDAPRQGEYLRFIAQECRRLSSLIENVLDFARIEQGRKQYEFEPTDLAALLQTTVKLMQPYAAEKGVGLRLQPVEGQPPAGGFEAEVDGRAVHQALVNLIDNAIKHSAKGEEVIVGIQAHGGQPENGDGSVKLFVSDHGPGIPREEQQKIFERFYRLGSELRRETQGVGIGLSVVKHIVESHGGRVTVQSEPGKGSRFTIQLPVKQQAWNAY